MAQQTIGVGSVANDGTGDPLRTAWTKANGNFTELYNGLGGLISKSGAAVALTGTLTETALATITIPANAVGANGFLRITSLWTMTNNANVKSPRVRLGGIGGTSLTTLSMTTEAYVKIETILFAANATNAQNSASFSERGTDQLITGGTSVVATTVDFTASQSLVLSGQLANTADTITLLGYIVEFMQ